MGGWREPSPGHVQQFVLIVAADNSAIRYSDIVLLGRYVGRCQPRRH